MIEWIQQYYILREFIKGGIVVSNILGIDTKSTRDIDATIKSSIYSPEEVDKIIQEICNTENHTLFCYSLISIKSVQNKTGIPEGFKIMLKATLD
ncbi:MAG: hypothetical protein LUG12_08545 [Erysipelotrichaceae bacterium]|nr:hypothetical protein [Erysipelotrichaceae bacterium]